jgi:hypothetical protein
MTDQPPPLGHERPKPRWQPIAAIDRRVVGVLMEKAKTSESAYPMTLNAIVTACNQKSNRSPLMQLEPEDVEESLDRLRHLGAVGLIEGYGRVAKYRHYMYDWLGVDKIEMAVMTELLLRGPQTEGDLRARAARMEPIRDLAELRPILGSLKAKGLVIPLTPEGRGHVVSHALFLEREMEKIRAQFAAGASVLAEEEPMRPPSTAAPVGSASTPGFVPAAAAPTGAGQNVDPLRQEIAALRGELAQLRAELSSLTAAMRDTDGELQRLKRDLGAM